jgi:hypothetical protein
MPIRTGQWTSGVRCGGGPAPGPWSARAASLMDRPGGGPARGGQMADVKGLGGHVAPDVPVRAAVEGPEVVAGAPALGAAASSWCTRPGDADAVHDDMRSVAFTSAAATIVAPTTSLRSHGRRPRTGLSRHAVACGRRPGGATHTLEIRVQGGEVVVVAPQGTSRPRHRRHSPVGRLDGVPGPGQRCHLGQEEANVGEQLEVPFAQLAHALGQDELRTTPPGPGRGGLVEEPAHGAEQLEVPFAELAEAVGQGSDEVRAVVHGGARQPDAVPFPVTFTTQTQPGGAWTTICCAPGVVSGVTALPEAPEIVTAGEPDGWVPEGTT